MEVKILNKIAEGIKEPTYSDLNELQKMTARLLKDVVELGKERNDEVKEFKEAMDKFIELVKKEDLDSGKVNSQAIRIDNLLKRIEEIHEYEKNDMDIVNEVQSWMKKFFEKIESDERKEKEKYVEMIRDLSDSNMELAEKNKTLMAGVLIGGSVGVLGLITAGVLAVQKIGLLKYKDMYEDLYDGLREEYDTPEEEPFEEAL